MQRTKRGELHDSQIKQMHWFTFPNYAFAHQMEHWHDGVAKASQMWLGGSGWWEKEVLSMALQTQVLHPGRHQVPDSAVS